MHIQSVQLKKTVFFCYLVKLTGVQKHTLETCKGSRKTPPCLPGNPVQTLSCCSSSCLCCAEVVEAGSSRGEDFSSFSGVVGSVGVGVMPSLRPNKAIYFTYIQPFFGNTWG